MSAELTGYKHPVDGGKGQAGLLEQGMDAREQRPLGKLHLPDVFLAVGLWFSRRRQPGCVAGRALNLHGLVIGP
jgi:hypothetical protein